VSTEPDHFTVSDEDDGQVLEDGVNGDRKELLSNGAQRTCRSDTVPSRPP
jgi:hypothetical protein